MKAFIKFGFIALGLALILAGVAALLLLTQAEGYGRGILEDRLAAVLRVPVHIERLSFAPVRHAADIHGLAIENPSSFKGGMAIEAARVTLQFDPTSLFSKQWVVQQIRFEGLDVRYRHELGDGTNLAALLAAAAEADTPESPGLVYKELACDAAKIHFSTNMIPGVSAGIRVVRIHETDLEGGLPLTGRQISALILKCLLRQTIRLKDQPQSDDTEPAIEAETL